MKIGDPRLLETGAVGSAVAASICCLGPLALALLGVGGGALLLKFAPFRPYSLGAAVLLLGGSFYLTYRRPAAECAPGSLCASESSRTRQKIVLWVVTGTVILAAAFPVWSKTVF